MKKCTQYGICGQATFKNVRAVIFWNWAGHAAVFSWDPQKKLKIGRTIWGVGSQALALTLASPHDGAWLGPA